MRHEPTLCLRCDEIRAHHSRYLCRPCFNAAGEAGLLDQFPLLARQRMIEFAEQYRILAARGLAHAEIADRMGYTNVRSWGRRLCRVRAAGLLQRPVTSPRVPIRTAR